MSGSLAPPPSWLSELPIVGRSAGSYWQSVVADPERLKQDLLPLVKPAREFLVTFIASIGSGVLEFALALLISGVLYVWAEDFGAVLNQIAERLGGEMGRRQIAVVESTIRGVFKGVIGTAAAQAGLALFGFWLAGVPGAFLLAIGTFFLSLIPGGPIVLWLPAAIWLNANGHGGWAIFMAIWGLVVVGGSDNLIRPLLIGKGVEAPMVLIFLGVVGGLFAFGFLGLFIGPTLLAVGYNLFQDWIVPADA
jgi:predicted PurR-regulated permease PerM